MTMTGRGPIELIEEGTRLARTSGLPALALYYIGTMPFVLAFLFFWADMSRDAYAYQRVLPGSIAVALLYLWMNAWQSAYAVELRSRLGGRPNFRWTPRRILRMANSAEFIWFVVGFSVLCLIGSVLSVMRWIRLSRTR